MLQQPSIEIFNIRIDEPVTTFTDLIVSAVCFYAFVSLTSKTQRNKVHAFLKYYFLSMGIATAIGGLIGHGFLYLFSFAWKLPGWLTSMVSIALLERAAIQYARKLISQSLETFFKWLNIIELITFIVITFTTLNFFFVEVHSAYGLLIVVTGFNVFIYRKTKSYGSKVILWAVVFSAISALVYMNEWAISKWFNHYDISHIFMAVSAWLFYKGSLVIIDDPDYKVKTKGFFSFRK
jgi:hypothetical protein